MATRVEIEHIASVVRYRSTAGNVGDWFDVAIKVRWLSPTRVEFMALDKGIDRAAWRELRYAFHEIGVRAILMQRYKNGRKRRKWIKTKRRPRGDRRPEFSPNLDPK